MDYYKASLDLHLQNWGNKSSTEELQWFMTDFSHTKMCLEQGKSQWLVIFAFDRKTLQQE